MLILKSTYEPETLAYFVGLRANLTDAQLRALDNNIKAIKYGSGITLSSVTCGLSMVSGGANPSGGAFVTNPSVDLCPYTNGTGWKFVFTDTANNTATIYAKSVGTGETFSSELLTSWVNEAAYPFETFTTSGADITRAINNVNTYGIAHKVLPSPGGKLLIMINSSFVLNSGYVPYWGLDDVGFNIVLQAVQGGTKYLTALSSVLSISVQAKGHGSIAVTDFSLTGNSVKQVLTPSTTGFVGTSTPGGTTYNWALIDAGYNPNSVQIITITRS